MGCVGGQCGGFDAPAKKSCHSPVTRLHSVADRRLPADVGNCGWTSAIETISRCPASVLDFIPEEVKGEGMSEACRLTFGSGVVLKQKPAGSLVAALFLVQKHN